MKKGRTVIYRDEDDIGRTFTMYEANKCVGTFLGDDPVIKEAIKAGIPIIEGLDNRT